MRWPIASLAATSALLLAGCGGRDPGPAIPRSDAQHLIALTHRVAAAKEGCDQQRAIAQVQAEATRLVNAGRVPPALEESLMSGVNALVADQPTCLPDVPVATTTPKPSPPAPRAKIHVPFFRPGHEHHHHGHGHGHGPGDRR